MTNLRDTPILNLKHRFVALVSRAVEIDNRTAKQSIHQPMDYDELNVWVMTLWQAIVSHYSEPHRYYHTLTHISSMLNKLDYYQSCIGNNNAVELAIWYHDIIYDPTRSDNERKSADYFIKSMQSRVSNQLISQVEALIMMTANHQVVNNAQSTSVHSESLIQDAKYMLDMDLAMLGADWITYHAYSQQVRLEYAHVDDDTFREGRKAVLEKFLTRDRLYFTEDFYHHYEHSARRNLTREIALLSN